MIGRWVVGLGLCVLSVACDRRTATPQDAAANDQAEAGASEDATSPDRGLAAEETAPDESVEPPREAEARADAEPTPTPRERASDLPPPTEAEFEAWDRKDPAGEKALYEWDRAHLSALIDYGIDLQCVRHRVRSAGQARLDGKSSEHEWGKAKRQLIAALDRWQKQLFADNPRIIEKSKFLGYLLESHELLMRSYPLAYDGGGGTELDKTEAHWMIVHAKARKYVEQLGGSYGEPSAVDCEQRKAKAP